MDNSGIFLIFQQKQDGSTETVLMKGHNLDYYAEIPNIIPKYSGYPFLSGALGITGCSRTDFGPQLNHFNKLDFTLVAIDPRGYGQSIPPYRDWPLEFIQRDAEDAMELIRVSTIHQGAVVQN